MSEAVPLPHPDLPHGDGVVDDRWLVRERPLRRGASEVQFGLDPEHGVVLSGLTEAEASWLLSLSRGAGWRGQPATSPARAWGLDPVRATRLVALLRRHGLLGGGGQLPATPRRRATVAVVGEGPLAARIRAQVRLSGVARVESTLGGRAPEMAVLVVRDVVPGHDARAWATSGLLLLPVVVGETWASIGPLVGRPETPCLSCLHLARRDQDPAWPDLVDQLALGRRQEVPVRADPALTASVCGVVGMLVQAHLADTPVPAGVSWRVRLPSPQVVAHRWRVHPRCPLPHGDGAP